MVEDGWGWGEREGEKERETEVAKKREGARFFSLSLSRSLSRSLSFLSLPVPLSLAVFLSRALSLRVDPKNQKLYPIQVGGGDGFRAARDAGGVPGAQPHPKVIFEVFVNCWR